MTRSRAMLLPSCGDPYITQGWIDNYKRFCKNSVDKLYVYVNSMAPDPVFNFVIDCFSNINAEIIESRRLRSHGVSLTSLVLKSRENFLFFTEEDFLIFDSKSLNDWYQLVETGKFGLVGSMRGCCNNELIKACASKFKLTGKEAQQPNFWPVPLVVRRNNILETDRIFCGPQHSAGIYLPEIDYTPSADIGGGDTFAWMSMQLRSQGLKVKQVRQYRYREGNKNYPWIHLGGGSSSLNGFLLDNKLIPIGHQTNPIKPRIPTDSLVEVFERRIGWWKAMRLAYPIPDSHQASYFNDIYLKAIDRCSEIYGIKRSEIDRHSNFCGRLIKK